MFRLFLQFLEPYTLLVLFLGGALIYLARKTPAPRRRLLWLAVPYCLLFLISTPAVSWLVMALLEWQTPVGIARPADARAIVVLGSGVLAHDPLLNRAELDGPALERTWHAARVYLSYTPCLVVVSGGRVEADDPEPPVADVMARELIRLGVAEKDILVENTSRNTYENSTHSAALLRERGVDSILLVTDAEHMPRAAACFRARGLTVHPSTGRWRSADWGLSPVHFLPSLRGLVFFHQAGREWAMLLVYRMLGRC